MITRVLIIFGLLFGISLSVQAQSDEGLVAEWHFDEGSGSVLKDSSGNGNDGVIFGATWIDGKYGKALSFDGVDDYVHVPTPYIISKEFSIEAWVKTASSASQTIFGGPAGDDKYRPIFGVGYGNSNGGSGCVNRYGTYIASNIHVNTNDWYHIVFVANDRGTDTTSMKIYINGALDNEINDPFIIQIWPETHFIGKRASENYFNGLIDEIRIYNRALTTEEIKQHYEVISSTNQSIALKSPTEISTASVHLHGEKTEVVLGEDILLKLAAVNLITKPTMHVQVIITPPSGMSVTSSEFVQSGAGLFTASYDIGPGVGRDIEVRMRSNQVGDFVVNGRIVYYFGDNIDNPEDHILTLPITVRAKAETGPSAEQTADTSGTGRSNTPGFAALVAVIGLLLAYLRRRI